MPVKIYQLFWLNRGNFNQTAVSLLAALDRHDFTINPVSLQGIYILYVCVSRTSGVDRDELEREMNTIINQTQGSRRSWWGNDIFKWAFA